MTQDEISYKDLSKRQLEILKGIYIDRRVSTMTEDELKEFVRINISDQINGTVGNEEEREAWKEMKAFFENDFEAIVKEVFKEKNPSDEDLDPEKEELERRLELLEKRKKEKNNSNDDMW
tara:strand:- start:582 stop:941 length:360 start_codon:yes stop_codon:yes gene_type:complete